MRGLSKAIVAGNLTRDPELRTTPNGATVCSFSVAVNRSYRDTSGETREETSFFDCTAWGKQGEIIAQYMHKGSAILLSGRLSQHMFEGKDGIKRSRVEVVMEDFSFIGSARDNASGDAAGGSYSGGYVGGSYGAGNAGGSYGAGNAKATKKATPSGDDANGEVPDDIPEEIDLSEVPF